MGALMSFGKRHPLFECFNLIYQLAEIFQILPQMQNVRLAYKWKDCSFKWEKKTPYRLYLIACFRQLVESWRKIHHENPTYDKMIKCNTLLNIKSVVPNHLGS